MCIVLLFIVCYVEFWYFLKLKNMIKIVFVEDDLEVGKLIVVYFGKYDIDVFVELCGDIV